MSVASVKVRESVVRRLREAVLKRVEELQSPLVEDNMLEVITALSDDDVEELVLEVLELAEGPLSWRELKAVFQGVVGEDRLRKILSKLKSEGRIAELTKTRYSLLKYVPPDQVEKIKNPAALRALRTYTYA